MQTTGFDYGTVSGFGYPFSDQSAIAELPGLCDIIDDIVLFGEDVLTRVIRSADSVTLEFGTVTAQLLFADSDPLVRAARKDGRPGGSIYLRQGWQEVAAAWPAGEIRIAAELVPSAYVPLPPLGLRQIVADGVAFTGEVCIVAEAGLMLNYRDGKLWLDCIGDARSRERSCEAAGVYATPTLVKTINNIGPGQDGSFAFIHSLLQSVDPALRIRPDKQTVLLEKL